MPARQSAAMDRAIKYVVRYSMNRADAARKAGVSWRALHTALKRHGWTAYDSPNLSKAENQ